MPERPNILFLCPDQWSFRAMEPYGNDTVRTPAMARMAAEGVVFDNFCANAALCGPNRFAIFTGHMPFGQANWTNPNCVELPYIRYMGHLFRDGGYHTGSIGKLHGMPEDFDFGFEHCRLNNLYTDFFSFNHYYRWLRERVVGRPDADTIRARIRGSQGCAESDSGAEDYFIPPELSQEEWMVEEAESFLRAAPADRPFLLHLGFNHPHEAWETIPTEDERYDWRAMSLPPNHEHKPGIVSACEEADGFYGPRDDLPEETWKRFRAKYYTCITQVDKAIGRVFDLLEKYHCAKNTLVVMTTDHGEMCGAHRRVQKGYFYEDAVHLPFLVSGPGVPKGERRAQLGEQIDILPTLMDYAGIDPVPSWEGRSLRKIVEDGGESGKPYAHAWMEFRGRIHQMVRSERYKLYRFCGAGNELTGDLSDLTELYDLRDDPYETNDLLAGGTADESGEIRTIKEEFGRYFWQHAGMIGMPPALRERLLGESAAEHPPRRWLRPAR